jgi:hypothetical protein
MHLPQILILAEGHSLIKENGVSNNRTTLGDSILFTNTFYIGSYLKKYSLRIYT